MSCLLATKLLAAASLECLNDGHVSKKLWPPDIHQHFYSKKSINRLILSEYYSAPCYFSCNKNLCVHPPTSTHFRKDKRIIKFIGMLSKKVAQYQIHTQNKGDTRSFFQDMQLKRPPNNKLLLQFENCPFIKLKRHLNKTSHNIIFTVYIIFGGFFFRPFMYSEYTMYSEVKTVDTRRK